MDIIDAIRELCRGEKGLETLFDESQSPKRLEELTEGDGEAALFAALMCGGARTILLEMINDAYHFQEYAVKAHGVLVADGMGAQEAKRALEIFFYAFGFPGYRRMAHKECVTEEKDNYKTVYEGEVKNGVPHGVGVRNFYYEGKWSSRDEGVWIDGVMCGYDHATELEFGAFEDQKIGFVVNDCFVGTIKVIPSDGEEFDDVVSPFAPKASAGKGNEKRRNEP